MPPLATSQRLGSLVDLFAGLMHEEISVAVLEPLLERAWALDAEFHSAVIELAQDELLLQIWRKRSIIVWLPTPPHILSSGCGPGVLTLADRATPSGGGSGHRRRFPENG